MATSVTGGGDGSWGGKSAEAVISSRVAGGASSSTLKPAFVPLSLSAAVLRIDSGEENAGSDRHSCSLKTTTNLWGQRRR